MKISDANARKIALNAYPGEIAGTEYEINSSENRPALRLLETPRLASCLAADEEEVYLISQN
jgi:hypothetical protein